MSNLTAEFVVADLAQTKGLAADLAGRLRGGEVIVLEGDLGAGKTAFVRGLVESLGGAEASSPSFTIENIYPTNSLVIHHYDFYRLTQLSGIDSQALGEVIKAGKAVVLIEWADLARHLLGQNQLQLEFQFEAAPSARRLIYRPSSAALDYLLPPPDLLTKQANGSAD